MFDKQYRFRGRHAVRVDALTSVFDSNSKAKLFERNVDVYANAPLVGFLYGRTAEQDDTRNPETNQVYNQNVMGDRVIYSQEELQFNFRLIMLLDKDYEPNEGERIDKAFKHMGENPDDIIFEEDEDMVWEINSTIKAVQWKNAGDLEDESGYY